MKLLYSLILTITALHLNAQHQVKGSIVDTDGKEVGFCHVYNKTLESGKVADIQGRFAVVARKHDTIEFSYVGYKTLKLIVGSAHLSNFSKITLAEDSIVLGAIRIYADKYFKVPLNTEGPAIIIPGVSVIDPPDPIRAGDFLPGGGVGVNGIPAGGVTLVGPITYFSKDEREKRIAEEAYAETQQTITYQKYIAQDSIRDQLKKLYRINDKQYDEVLIRLHEYWPDIQKSYYPKEIWNWLLTHFDRTVPIVKTF